jgi:hypothetical protein
MQKKSAKDEKPNSKMKRKMTMAEQKELHEEKKAEMTKTQIELEKAKKEAQDKLSLG